MTHRIDDNLVGLTAPDFAFPIERGKVREFAAATGAFLPEYMDDPRPVIPPTFLVVAAYLYGYWLEHPGDSCFREAGLEDAMSLDGGQTFTYPDVPPRAGDVLTGTTFVEDVWHKQGRTGGALDFARICTRFRDRSGDIRAEWRAVSVIPEILPQPPDEAPVPPAAERPFMGHGEQRDQIVAIETQSAENLAQGQGPGAITMPPLTLTEVARYGFVSGEDGPAHHDDAAARAEGFPSFFSIGMYHAGLLGSYAAAWLGPHRVRGLSTRIHDMMWPGDVLTYAGTVANVTEKADARHINIDLVCTRGDTTVVSGSAVFAA